MTLPGERRAGRSRPYTWDGIKRLACSRVPCTNRAQTQWNACSDGNAWRPLCVDCDVELNAAMLRLIGDPDADAKLAAYTARARELHGPAETHPRYLPE